MNRFVLLIAIALALASSARADDAILGDSAIGGPRYGGGGFLTMADGDARYLKLAADNDPLTGRLDLRGSDGDCAVASSMSVLLNGMTGNNGIAVASGAASAWYLCANSLNILQVHGTSFTVGASGNIVSLSVSGTTSLSRATDIGPVTPAANAGTTDHALRARLTTPADSSGTNIHDAVRLTVTIGNATAGTNTVRVIDVDAITGDPQVNVIGLNIASYVGPGAESASAITIGSLWDFGLDTGSGIRFSGVTTDITTGTNEDLSILPDGTGDTWMRGDSTIVDNSVANSDGLIVSGLSGSINARAVWQTCGNGHACLSIDDGAGSRQASLSLLSTAAGQGPEIALWWNNATDDRELWKWVQTATALQLRNQDEDVSATTNFTPISISDTSAGGITLGSQLFVSPAASASTALTITGANNHTGKYFDILEEQTGTSVFAVTPNGTSGAVQLNFRPIVTGAGSSILSFGSQGTQYFALDASGVVNFTGSAPVFSGLTLDITTGTNEDLTVRANGTGVVRIQGGTNSGADVVTATFGNGGAASNDLQIVTNSGSGSSATIRSGAGSGGTIGITSARVNVGSSSNVAATTVVTQLADGISVAGATGLFLIYGEGAIQSPPNSAMTISNPTDTTSTPWTAQSETCLITAAGAAAWTPAESTAVNGSHFCCTNVGAQNITMTDSAGVYNGPGSVVGPDDTVCFRYITDHWAEESFSNN